MKKYIGAGLLVFAFTFMALFLALDNKEETYAVLIDTPNCPGDSANYSVTTLQIGFTELWQVIVKNPQMSESCCKNTMGWNNYYTEVDSDVINGICSTSITATNKKLYYHSISSKYCAKGFQYNSTTKTCENKNIVKLKYECGSIDCTSTPVQVIAPKESNGTEIYISEIVPSARNSNYIFRYWTNKNKTRKYSSNCNGLSNCSEKIRISKNNALYGVWRKVELANEEEFASGSSNIIIKSLIITLAVIVASCLGYSYYCLGKLKKQK